MIPTEQNKPWITAASRPPGSYDLLRLSPTAAVRPQKAEAARAKERKRREQAIAKAEAALEEAKRDHETKGEEIQRQRAALDRRA
jgi:hypothetical protein